jgi:hypothetical protein
VGVVELIQRIPIDARSSAQEFEAVLAGNVYRFGFRWNWREGFWHMDIATRNRVPLLAGIKIVLNYELIGRFTDERLPPGFMVALDTTRRLERIGRFQLGSEVPLVFVPRTVVEAAQ